jgi:hypothetical protein
MTAKLTQREPKKSLDTGKITYKKGWFGLEARDTPAVRFGRGSIKTTGQRAH